MNKQYTSDDGGVIMGAVGSQSEDEDVEYSDDEISGGDRARGEGRGDYQGGGFDGQDMGGLHGYGDPRSRTKRRSKNDQSGRNFVCGCKKKYLSYPALYTHIKQKHGGIAPPGTNTSQLFTGRGRGRPRKTLAVIDGRNNNDKIEEYFSSGSEMGYFGNYNSKGPSDTELAQLN